ncbi:MAG: DUF2520 domain-containing protein [Bacteroidetes bacterium]|nr:DUF2520 domain-containing protein [Bacteroidota bacterium]
MKIVILGSGNIATFFAHRFQQNGHEIVQVYSRTELHAQQLASQLHCNYTSSLHEINKTADVYVLAVSDDAVLTICETLNLNNKLVLHTAGTLSLHHIDQSSANTGSIWCVYSIQKHAWPNHKNIPCVINASNEESLLLVQELAKCISDQIIHLDDELKLNLHVAAVFANNFSNYLFGISYDILKNHNLSFNILLPLIQDTVNKLIHLTPTELQSGPAKRGDVKTIEKHLTLLSSQTQYQEIYKLLSEAIMKANHFTT